MDTATLIKTAASVSAAMNRMRPKRVRRDVLKEAIPLQLQLLASFANLYSVIKRISFYVGRQDCLNPPDDLTYELIGKSIHNFDRLGNELESMDIARIQSCLQWLETDFEALVKNPELDPLEIGKDGINALRRIGNALYAIPGLNGSQDSISKNV